MAYDFTKFKKSLLCAEDWIKKEFSVIRTGQASPSFLDSIKVESYGSIVPLSQIASVVSEGSRTLRIAPWDVSQLKEIEKAITIANLGISLSTDEKGLRANFPELTSERRIQITKIAKDKLEEGRKQIRMHRDEVLKDIKNKEKAGGIGKDDIFRYEKEIQKYIDGINKRLDELYSKKEREITA